MKALFDVRRRTTALRLMSTQPKKLVEQQQQPNASLPKVSKKAYKIQEEEQKELESSFT
jgi:hypothetical protein